jgi:hypothetical protein
MDSEEVDVEKDGERYKIDREEDEVEREGEIDEVGGVDREGSTFLGEGGEIELLEWE